MAENADPTKKPDAAEGAPDANAQPKFMTAEDYNKAATAREKRLLNQIQELLKAQQKPAPAPAEEEEEEEVEETDEVAEETTDEEPKPAKKPAAPAKKPGLTKAEIQAKKAMEKIKAVERERKAEKEKAELREKELAEREEKTATQAALTQAGAINQKQALAVLKAEGRIKRGDDGELIFVMPRDIAGEKFDEELPLADGIKEWLSSDEGKIYAPPRGAEGSGATGQTKQKSLKEMSKSDRKKAAGATLLKWAMNR